MTLLILLVHIAVCLVLILVVLLQTGKRADLAGAFGGGGSQTAFGTRGAATFLSRATTWSAAIFMATSLILGVRFGADSSHSVVKEPTSSAAPQTPPPAPAPAPVPAAIPGAEGATPAAPAPTSPSPKPPPAQPVPSGSETPGKK